MRRWPNPATAFLIAIALLISAEVKAQAHGPPATEVLDEPEVDHPAAQAAKIVDLDAWLRKMTGRFRLSSAINSERPGLLVDCVGVGDGPGVQCVTGRGGNTPQGEEANASMQLFGLDPLALTISRLTVNARGIAQHSQGKLKGDMLVFPRINCAVPENIRNRMRMISCEEILKIRSLSNGQELQFTTEVIQRILPPSVPAGRRRETGSRTINFSSTMWMKRVAREERVEIPN
jgi:hypothetical protein